MQTILIGTKNPGKVKEIEGLIADLPINIVSLMQYPDLPEVEEDGITFEENALKKARAYSALTGLPALADDSGLVVDALNGAPGVFSARYAGAHSTDEQKYLKVLAEIQDVEDSLRSARFVCVLALALPSGAEHIFRGTCEGFITREPRGSGGFGYDPIFYYPDAGMTFGQMDMTAKNAVSHRGRALKLFAEFCKQEFSK